MAREIPITKNKIAIVSEEDYGWVHRWKWHYHSCGYAARRKSVKEGRQTVFMHQEIARRAYHECPDGCVTDHINRDPLDNRRSNLRYVTHAVSALNRGPFGNRRFIGVHRDTTSGKWAARISRKGEMWFLGLYDDEEEAAYVRDQAALQIHGKYACLNILPKSLIA